MTSFSTFFILFWVVSLQCIKLFQFRTTLTFPNRLLRANISRTLWVIKTFWTVKTLSELELGKIKCIWAWTPLMHLHKWMQMDTVQQKIWPGVCCCGHFLSIPLIYQENHSEAFKHLAAGESHLSSLPGRWTLCLCPNDKWQFKQPEKGSLLNVKLYWQAWYCASYFLKFLCHSVALY